MVIAGGGSAAARAAAARQKKRLESQVSAGPPTNTMRARTEGKRERVSHVQALVRPPSYVAMVVESSEDMNPSLV